LPELEVDLCSLNDHRCQAQVNVFALDDDCLNLKWILCALNDRSYQAQVNVFALDNDCLNLKWICVPSMIAATKLRRMCLPSMMIA
jgi:hypothetical protein